MADLYANHVFYQIMIMEHIKVAYFRTWFSAIFVDVLTSFIK